MKRILLSTITVCMMMVSATAQNTEHKDNLNSRTSWLKAGIEASIPVGNTSNVSSFATGAVISAQMMANPNLGLGVATGYTHFFGKNGVNDFGAIPLGALIRYYPKEPGLLAGTDIGYTFTNNFPGNNGGFYLKPQLGWHNHDWNIYGFYNHVFMNGPMGNLQNFGATVSYNIRFNQ